MSAEGLSISGRSTIGNTECQVPSMNLLRNLRVVATTLLKNWAAEQKRPVCLAKYWSRLFPLSLCDGVPSSNLIWTFDPTSSTDGDTIDTEFLFLNDGNTTDTEFLWQNYWESQYHQTSRATDGDTIDIGVPLAELRQYHQTSRAFNNALYAVLHCQTFHIIEHLIMLCVLCSTVKLSK